MLTAQCIYCRGFASHDFMENSSRVNVSAMNKRMSAARQPGLCRLVISIVVIAKTISINSLVVLWILVLLPQIVQ